MNIDAFIEEMKYQSGPKGKELPMHTGKSRGGSYDRKRKESDGRGGDERASQKARGNNGHNSGMDAQATHKTPANDIFRLRQQRSNRRG